MTRYREDATEVEKRIYDVAEKLGVELDPSFDSTLSSGRYAFGSTNTAIDFKRRVVIWDPDYYHYNPNQLIPSAELLHEVIHVALGKPSLKANEAYVLLSYEVAVARYIARRVKDRSAATEFMYRVFGYQRTTIVDPLWDFELSQYVWSEHWRTAWFREGIRRVQEAGLLDAKRRPTWKVLSEKEARELQEPGNIYKLPRSKLAQVYRDQWKASFGIT
jgi:hypothetical protein